MFAQHGSETSLLLENSGQEIAEMPILVLNAHGRCNCRCVMCDIWKREEGTEVSVADLERHRSSLRRLSVRWVVLSGGEPLMHSNLRGLCTFFRELGIRLTLLTTGLLLTRRAAEVCELFDDIIISVDGPAAVHDAIRRVKDGFRLIRSGITAVRQFRPAIRITGRTTVQKANHRYLQDTVLSTKALGLDAISFLAADVTSEAFNRPLIWPGERQSEIALSADEVSELEQEIEDLIARFGEEILSGYIAESAPKLRRIVAHFQAHLGHTQHESPPCNAPWVSAVIEADGAVRPCFFHPPIGNIHEASLEEIVNGDIARAFRRDLNIADNPTCRRCVCSLNHPTSQGFRL
jgi:Fe-coproporphyrin III synthase